MVVGRLADDSSDSHALRPSERATHVYALDLSDRRFDVALVRTNHHIPNAPATPISIVSVLAVFALALAELSPSLVLIPSVRESKTTSGPIWR